MKLKILTLGVACLLGAVSLDGKAINETKKNAQIIEDAVVDNAIFANNPYLKNVKSLKASQNNGFLSIDFEDDLANYYTVEKTSSNNFLQKKILNVSIEGVQNVGLYETTIEVISEDGDIESTDKIFTIFENETNDGITYGNWDINGHGYISIDDCVKDTDFSVYREVIWSPVHTGPEEGGGSSGANADFDEPEINVDSVNATNVFKVISDTINNVNDYVETDLNLKDYLKVPDLFKDGFVEYIYFYTKVSSALGNYRHNSKLTQPTDYIYDQSEFDKDNKWHFGKFGNITDNGCSSIAIFNWLRLKGKRPSLAYIIFLVEILNADLAFGKIGASPFNKAELKTFREFALNYYKENYSPYVKMMADIAKDTIRSYYDDPWFLICGFLSAGGNYLSCEASCAGIDLCFIKVDGELVPFLVDLIIDNTNEISLVLNAFVDSDQIETVDTYSNLEYEMETNDYCIICYWNEVEYFEDQNNNYYVDEGEFEVNMLGGAHYIFVGRDYYGLCAYNDMSGVEHYIDDLFESYAWEEQVDAKLIRAYIVK